VTKNSDPPSLGQRVEIVRAKRGISRTALAATLELDRSTVAKWATGESSPRDLEAVAAALGATVAEIYAARPDRRQRRAAA
jgi:transcriptional regulator with XRE-family HTH domain